VRSLALLIAVSTLLAAVGACGGSSKKSATATPEPPTDEAAFATSMLVTLSDFPNGWIEKPSDRPADAQDGPIQRCATKTGRTGRAVSNGFAPDAAAADVVETIVVFDSAGHASEGVEQTPDLIDCVVKALNSGELDTDAVRLSNAASKNITLDARGDQSRSYVVSATATAREGTPRSLYKCWYMHRSVVWPIRCRSRVRRP
jgi:hypothetical protein